MVSPAGRKGKKGGRNERSVRVSVSRSGEKKVEGRDRSRKRKQAKETREERVEARRENLPKSSEGKTEAASCSSVLAEASLHLRTFLLQPFTLLRAVLSFAEGERAEGWDGRWQRQR